jgi:hypothetical protein
MADNSNNNPNPSNPIEPNKKRYTLPSPNSTQKSTGPTYPQSLINKDNKANLADQLKAKFSHPEPKAEAPKPIPITLQNEENIITSTTTSETPKIETPTETKNFRYEENKQEYALPIQEPKKVQEVSSRETVTIEPTKVEAIPINLGTQTESIAEPIAPKQEVKIEPTIQATVEPRVEPKIEPKAAIKVEPKLEPKLDVNPLPPEIESAVTQAVAENKQDNTTTIEVTKPEEPINKVVKENKYSLPGTDTDKGFQSESDKIRDELTSKFAPKVEAKIEEVKVDEVKVAEPKPTQNVLENLLDKIDEKIIEPINNIEVSEAVKDIVKDAVIIEAPKVETPKLDVTLDVNPLPPAIENAVKESQIPDVDNEAKAEVTTPEEPINKVVKNNKYSLPGTEAGEGFKTSSEKIREDIAAKFRPKVEVEQNVSQDIAQDVAQDVSQEQASDNTEVPVPQEVAAIIAAATVAPIVNPAILDGIKPLIKLNEEEPITDNNIQDVSTDTEVAAPTNAAEFLKQAAEGKQEPKYQLRPDTKNQQSSSQSSPIVESAAVAAGAIGGINIGTRVDTNRDDRVQYVQNTNTSGAARSQSTGGKSRINQSSNVGTSSSSNSSQSSDPNRYITAPSTTTSGGKTETTKTTTTTQIANTTMGAKITFDVTRQSIRSAGGKNTKKQAKLNAAKAGLIALGAAIALNQVAAGAVRADSGIFDGVNSDGSAVGTQVVKAGTNFLIDEANVGPKYQPTAINEFGQRQGTYDADGKFTETPKTITDPNDPNFGRDNKPKAKNAEDGIPALGSAKKDEQGFADQGGYDADGNLKQALVSGDALELNQVNRPKQQILDDDGNPIPQLTQEQRESNAINNAPGAIPTGASQVPGQQQGGPSAPAPTNSAAPIPSSADQNKGGELTSGKKESLPSRIMQEVIKVYAKQAMVLLCLIMLTLIMILGIALGAGYFLLASACSNGAMLQFVAAAGLAGNQGADAFYKTCEAFTAFTGIGCGSTPDTASGNGECISDYLDATGDTINMSGFKGDTKAKKAVIKDLISIGKKAAGNKNEEVQMMVSVYAAITTTNGFATNESGCLGFFRLCKADYAKYTEGLGVKDEGDFLLSKEKQVAAFLKKYNDRIPGVDKLPQCAKDGFKNNFGDNLKGVKKIEKSSPEYKKLYTFLHDGPNKCPDDKDLSDIKYTDYIEAATRNYQTTNCTKFKARITVASNDNTYYHLVANSISSIGSYIGNGLNKFNLNLSITAEAQKSINPNGDTYQASDALMNAKTGYATKTETDQLIQMLANGKVVASANKSFIIGDILGNNSNSISGKKNNGPIHTNLAKFLIFMGNTGLGPRISSLANNTHIYRRFNSFHHTDPGLAVDFSGFNGQDGMPDSTPTEVVAPFLKAAGESKLVLQLLTNKFNNNKTRFDALNTGLNIGFDKNPNHFHFQIDSKGVLGSSSGTSAGNLTADCPTINAPIKSTKSTSETRLNKKSLTEDKWTAEKAKFPGEPAFGDALQKAINYQTQDMPFGLNDKVKLFDSDAATNKIYELAEGSGYQYRNRAVQGGGDNDLNGGGEYAMKRKAGEALKKLFAAMTLDGIQAKQGASYEEPAVTKTKLEQAILKACNGCSAADIASGNKDTIIQEVFKTQNVPNMTLLSTGHVAQVIDNEIPDLTKFQSSKTFKYFTEDNELNLKRFGFTFAHPEDLTKPEPLQRPNLIIWLGREVLEN